MRYAVDPTVVSGQAVALDQVRQELSGSRLLGDVDELVLGAPEVVAAVRSACRNWSIARGRLEGELSHLAAATSRAAQTYAEVDRAAVPCAQPGRPG
jgi:hypothetical protein